MNRPNLRNALPRGLSASAKCINAGSAFFSGSIADGKRKTAQHGDNSDEVLARLLELNEQRHKEELLLAKSKKSEKKLKPATKRVTRKTQDGSSQTELF